MSLRTIKQLTNLSGKRILVRVDFNVPIKNKKILDDSRLRESLPTIQCLIRQGAKVILVSHLGRPKKIDKKLSLEPIKIRLEKLMHLKIKYLINPKQAFVKYFDKVKKEIGKMKSGSICLLENIRFFPGEEENNGVFSHQLASLADIFVLDGFAVAHRDSASVSGVVKFLPSYAGLLLEKEIIGLNRLLEKPKKPFIAIIGGVKIETKLPVIKNLLPKVNHILIGGGLANTYLKAMGYKVGDSLVDNKFLLEAKKILSNKKIIKPVDVTVGTADGKKFSVVEINSTFHIPHSTFSIYDIGPETIRLYSQYIKKAQTLVWNGAMGFFEQKPYDIGTLSIARLVASRSRGRAYGAIGGGETIQSMMKVKMIEDVDFVSTGGGAMLKYLAGEMLPGLDALLKQ